MPGVSKQTLSFALGRGGEGVQSSQVLGPVLRGPPHATFKTSPHRESRGPEMGESPAHITQRERDGARPGIAPGPQLPGRTLSSSGEMVSLRLKGGLGWPCGLGFPHTPGFWGPPRHPHQDDGRIVYLSQSVPPVTWGGTNFTLQTWKLRLGEAWKAQQCRATLQTSQLFTSISQASQYLGAGGGADGHMADTEAAGGGIHYLDSSHSEI